MTSGPESDSLVVIANAAEGRALFLLPWRVGYQKDWRAERARVPADILTAEVTACTASENALYLALKDKGIRRLSFRHVSERSGVSISEYIEGEAPFWQASKQITLDAPGGRKNFTGLAVAELETGWEVVYGVTGDDTIYRFTAEGVPDQRIEVELPPSARTP